MMTNKLLKLLTLCGLLLCISAADSAERVTYLHNDALGSVVASTDDYGQVLWSEEYEAFGKRKLKEEPGDNEIWFTGKPELAAVDLQYFGARWYDPDLGIFISQDPVGVSGSNPYSFNKYTYANNNPYKYVDPDGEFPILVWLATPPGIAALKAAGDGLLLAGGIISAAYIGETAINAYNESTDPVHGILEGAQEGEKTKGRTKNYDKPGGFDEANNDFDTLVPGGGEPITDSKGGEGRKGVMDDGRKVNVRPNSTDGRPTLEVKDGKSKTKLRYDD